MKHKYFYNSALFRVVSPVLFGLLTYLLVLMFFDSIGMLLENFFSREILFIVGLTLLFFEVNRLNIIVNDKLFPVNKNLKLRIIVQYIGSFAITIILVSTVLYFYFFHIEGFSTIQTELITFNGIYLLIAIFYNLFFFSLVFVNRKNESKVHQEETKQQNLMMELESFKYQINPDFLFQSLETIISELYRDKKSADDQINNLSKIYRYTLDNKHNDLVSLKDELESLKPVCEIFQPKYGQSLELKIAVDKDKYTFNLIPGSLKLILEYALSECIISKSLPLIITITEDGEKQLVVQYPLSNKLITDKEVHSRIEFLFKAYGYYTNQIDESNYLIEENGNRKFTIPLLEVEEE